MYKFKSAANQKKIIILHVIFNRQNKIINLYIFMKKFFTTSLCALGFMCAFAQQAGELDPSFGNSGELVLEVTPSFDNMYNLAPLSDGKILVVGPARENIDDYYYSILRLNNDGTLDTTFGEEGRVVFNPTNDYGNFPQHAEELEDGSYLIAGYLYSAINWRTNYILVKLNNDGTFNESFGDNGIVIGNNTSHQFTLETMTVLEDGKILIGGYYDDQIALMKFNEDGSIDETFGNQGVAQHELINSFMKRLAVQEDGKIVVAGYYIVPGTPRNQAVIGRFNSDGTTDTTFGTAGNGLVEINIGTDHSFMLDADIQADGKIVAAGHFWSDDVPVLQYDIVTLRLNEDGSFDTSFGENGMFTYVFTEDVENYSQEIMVAADSTIFLAGKTGSAYTDFDIFVANFNTDGTLNPEFGNNGIYIHPRPDNVDEMKTMRIDNENKIIAGGYTFTTDSGADFLIIRLYTDIPTYEAIADSENNTLSVYPNPAADYINVKFDNNKTYKADIVDLNGRVVKTISVSSGSQINVADLNSGHYLLILKDNQDTKVARIVKK